MLPLVLMLTMTQPTPGGTQAVVELPLATVRERLLATTPPGFDFEQQPAIDSMFRFSPGGFSGDAPLSLGYYDTSSGPALARWVALPDAARKFDLKLSSNFAGRWRDHPGWAVPGLTAAYFCHYIVHLEAIDERTTRVELIAFGARTRDGTEWSFTAQDGWPTFPHRVAAWRDVKPSAADKEAMLALLLKALQ